MENVNWIQLGLAGGLGLVVGLVVLLSGLWMDRCRERRFDREVRSLTEVSNSATSAGKGMTDMGHALARVNSAARWMRFRNRG